MIPAPSGTVSRALVAPFDPAASTVGAPPRPDLAAPWSTVAVKPDGPELDLVTTWMSQPHVARFWHQAWPRSAWAEEIDRQHVGDHSRPWLVALDDEPLAYVEVYRVARDVIAAHHPVDPHDLGVHLAIGDPDRTGRGLGPRLLAALAEALLAADPACGRIVGDPDATHRMARSAFAAAGFAPVAEIDLPHKRAALVARLRSPAGERSGAPVSAASTGSVGSTGPAVMPEATA